MTLTMWWFVVNMIFVIIFIIYLFAHRAYKEALQAGDAALIRRRKAKRTVLGLSALLAFAGMAAIFIANMAVNG